MKIGIYYLHTAGHGRGTFFESFYQLSHILVILGEESEMRIEVNFLKSMKLRGCYTTKLRLLQSALLSSSCLWSTYHISPGTYSPRSNTPHHHWRPSTVKN